MTFLNVLCYLRVDRKYVVLLPEVVNNSKIGEDLWERLHEVQ